MLFIPGLAMIHEDLLAIRRLWSNMEAATQLEGERNELLRQLEAARATLKRIDTEAEACTAKLKSLKQHERGLMRKLETYQLRVVRTRELIDTGKASDYQLAQRQLAACTDICDQVETEVLEQMEEIDATRQHQTDLAKKRQVAKQAEDDLQRKCDVGLPHIEEELTRLRAEGQVLAAEIPTPLKGTVNRLLSQRRSLVSPMRAKACAICNFSAPPQVVLEINRGVRVHTCRHCGRFLLPDED